MPGEPSIDDKLAQVMREAEQAEAARAREKTARALASLEESARAADDISIKRRELLVQINRLQADLSGKGAELLALPAKEEGLSENAALRVRPEHLAQARKLIQEEKASVEETILKLTAELGVAQREIERQDQKLMRVLDGVRPLLGLKETPPERVDEIWRYVQHERDLGKELKRYSEWGAGSGGAVGYLGLVQSDSEGYRDHTQEFKEDGHYLWGIPTRAFWAVGPELQRRDPDEHVEDIRFYNALVAACDRAVREARVVGGYKHNSWDKDPIPLSPAALASLGTGKLAIKFIPQKGEPVEIVLYDGDRDIPLLPTPEDPLLASLTEGEKLVVADAINDPYMKREVLEGKLVLSEHEGKAHEQIRAEAEQANQEFDERQLQTKLPELERWREELRPAIEAAEARCKLLDGAWNRGQQISEKQRQLTARLSDIRVWEKGETDCRERIIGYEKALAALPRWPSVLGAGGGIRGKKARQEAAEIERKIKTNQEQAARNAENAGTDRQRIAELTASIERLAVGLRRVDPECIGADNSVKWDYGAFSTAEREADQTRQQKVWELRVADGAEKLWRDRKFVLYSLPEMAFVVPREEKGPSRLDLMVGDVVKKIQSYYDPFERWSQKPKSCWRLSPDGKKLEFVPEWSDDSFSRGISRLDIRTGYSEWWQELSAPPTKPIVARDLRSKIERAIGGDKGEVKIELLLE
ncbi:MAG: hypothetical protein HY978_04990 [Candidatus Liptonbacteria bacterium]|nr:hypothetical protein [Candidatus Liptonbacteria bacterium]